MKTAIIGIGNILFKDEGVGVYASKYLEENFNFSNVEVIDGGTLGFKLMSYYQEYDKVIILDTVSIKDEAGGIYNLPSEALMDLGEYRQTAHEVEVLEMLEICSMLDKMAKVNIIGVIPADIVSVEINLTDTLKASFEALINEVLNELKRENITFEKKEEIKTLDEIIEAYANPTAKLMVKEVN